jgi:hypothetical protein
MIRRDTAENRRQRRPYTTEQRAPSPLRRALSSIAALIAPRRPQARRSV